MFSLALTEAVHLERNVAEWCRHKRVGGATVAALKAAFMDKLGKVLYQAAPLMMCGLSVGFAFKTGLFNIGASGQYTMGAFFSLLCAIQFQLP